MKRLLEEVHRLLTHLENAPRVLLVEDEAKDAELSMPSLRALGCMVQWARDQDEAMAALKAPDCRFELILLDLKLPHGSGLDVLKAIKQIMPSVPVVIVSGFLSGPELSQCAKLGYVGMIEKPLMAVNMGEVLSAHKLNR